MFQALAHSFQVLPTYPGVASWLIISLLPWYLMSLSKSDWRPKVIHLVIAVLAIAVWIYFVHGYVTTLRDVRESFGLSYPINVNDVLLAFAKSMGVYGPLALTISLAILIAVHGRSEEDYQKGISGEGDHRN